MITNDRARIESEMKPDAGSKRNGIRNARTMTSAARPCETRLGMPPASAGGVGPLLRLGGRSGGCGGGGHQPASLVLLADESLRTEDHHDHQVGEHDGRRPLGADAVVRQLLDDPDDQAAEHGAPEVADAAHDGRREGDQAGLEALVEADRRLVQRVDEAGRAGEHAAGEEGQRDRRVDVDPLQAGGVRILRGRAHRPAEPGGVDERHEAEDERRGHQQGEDVGAFDADAEDAEHLLLGAQQVRHRGRGATAPQQADVEQDEGESRSR